MTSLMRDFLTADYAQMTMVDWFGLVLTVTVFIMMVVVYTRVLHPKYRASIEVHRHHLLKYDDPNDDQQ